jgi:hypothetical protein
LKKPWSISTTVRNPERLRDFLKVLKHLENQVFDANNQIKYQVMLIQEKLYKPIGLTSEYNKYYVSQEEISYEIAYEIFNFKNYEDPPMRGRQSVNPLNKLGFSIARENYGKIIITDLGNKFLEGDYDISFIFFKSMLKLQFPNPWSLDFSGKEGFNIMPFISVLRLFRKIEEYSDSDHLTKDEFYLFIPTLTDYKNIDEQVKNILKYRKSKDRDKFILNFIKKFYETDKINKEKINDIIDYGDNILRYFRLTKYFSLTIDSLGGIKSISLEKSRLEEIKQLINRYSGEAFHFKDINNYLDYLSDLMKPELPWENQVELRRIANSLKNDLNKLIRKENISLAINQKEVMNKEIMVLSKEGLNKYIYEVRKLKIEIISNISKVNLQQDKLKILTIINILKDRKLLRRYNPEQFEKLITEALMILNDEILIKPNYPVDDNGNPINHASGNRPDIECYYEKFRAICEVTLNTSKSQWISEGQPIMRHLRDFEILNSEKDVVCLFIAPFIHNDTYSTYWISVKYEYDGKPQKIIPLTTEQFVILLETFLEVKNNDKKLNHFQVYDLYFRLISATKSLNSFSEWSNMIGPILSDWSKGIIENATK